MSSNLEFNKYLAVLLKYKKIFIIVSLSIMTRIFLISYLLPKKYEASSTVFIEKNVITDLVKGIAITPSMEDSLRVLRYAINSRTMVLKVLSELDVNLKAKNDAQLEAMLRNIQNNVDIKQRDKDLFIISFQHEDPKFSRDYVNTLIRIYIEENVSSKRGESFGATKFLSEQIGTYKEKLDKADADVNKFKNERSGVVSLDEGRLFTEINNAKEKLYDLQLRRSILEGQQKVTKTAADPLKSTLKLLQRKLSELRIEYTENYPEIIRIKADIENIKEQIKDGKGTESNASPEADESLKVQEELNAIKTYEDSLQHHIEMNQRLLSSIPNAKADLDKLVAEKNNQKQMFDQLYMRHNQSEVSKQMELQDKSTTYRIVDPAVTPIKPASPNRVKTMLIGIISGLAAGMVVLLVLDFFDQSVKTTDSLKSLGYNLLAVIPKIIDEGEMLAERKKDLKLFYYGGAWISVLLLVLAVESIGWTFIDTTINMTYLPHLGAKVTGWFN